MKHVIERYLHRQTGLSVSQVETLMTLVDMPVMDYQVVELMTLFPRSKMRRRVLDPLHQQGWIIFHSFPSRNERAGAPRLAWSLNPTRRDEWVKLWEDAERWAEKHKRKATLLSEDLARDLYGSNWREEVRRLPIPEVE